MPVASEKPLIQSSIDIWTKTPNKIKDTPIDTSTPVVNIHKPKIATKPATKKPHSALSSTASEFSPAHTKPPSKKYNYNPSNSMSEQSILELDSEENKQSQTTVHEKTGQNTRKSNPKY